MEDCKELFHHFKDLLARDEPLPQFETRFPNKLEGILGSVQQTWDGTYLNNTVLEAAASYFNQLARGHAFENGNKRCAVLFTQWFLISNKVDVILTPKEMYTLAVEVARAGEAQIKPEEDEAWKNLQ